MHSLQAMKRLNDEAVERYIRNLSNTKIDWMAEREYQKRALAGLISDDELGDLRPFQKKEFNSNNIK